MLELMDLICGNAYGFLHGCCTTSVRKPPASIPQQYKELLAPQGPLPSAPRGGEYKDRCWGQQLSREPLTLTLLLTPILTLTLTLNTTLTLTTTLTPTPNQPQSLP